MLVVEGAALCSHLSALKLECSIYRSGRENGLAAVGAIVLARAAACWAK